MSAIGLQCNPSAPDPSPGLYDNPLSVMVALEDAGFPEYAADAMPGAHRNGGCGMTRDAFPPLRELPAMFACYGLTLLGFAYFINPPAFRAFVARLIGG